MAQWDHTLDLTDIWRNEEFTFEQRRDEIVRRIKAARWFTALFDEYIDEIVDNIADAEGTSVFDNWWDQFYDWADDHSVWVATNF